MTISLNTSLIACSWGNAAPEAQLKIQPVIPITLWRVQNLLRLTLPYHVAGEGPAGLEDIALFDLAEFTVNSVRVGIGPEFTLSARESSNPTKVAVGPAIGFVDRVSSDFKFGAFNQNVFGDGFAETQLQPIVAYQLGTAWSLAAGDLQFTYDWSKRHWTKLPLGAQLGLVAALAKQQLHLSISLQYNLRQLRDSERFKVVFGFAFLAPEL